MTKTHCTLARSIAVFAFIALLSNTSGNSQSIFNWALQGGGSYNSDTAYAVASDEQGQSYLAGSFYGQLSFGTTNVPSPYSGYSESFVAKFSATGGILWAKSMNCYSGDGAKGITSDSAGNVFVTGFFTGTANPGDTNITSSSGTDDMYLSKYDPQGNLLWIVTSDGNSSDSGNAVAVDKDGNAYVGGYFYGTASFGGANGIVSYNGNSDGFIAKYDPSGNLVWVEQAGGTGSDNVQSLSVDRDGNIVVVGTFADTAMFGETCIISKGGTDAFVAKYSPLGDLVWVKQMGGPSTDVANGAAVDPAGNYLVTGYFNESLRFGNTNLTSFGSLDIFTAKLDQNGNLLWIRQAGGGNPDYSNGISVDTNGNAFITGSFYNNLNFGSTNLTGYGYDDIFAAKYSSEGILLWAISSGSGNGYDAGYAVSATKAGNFFVAGQFSGSATFGSTNLNTYSSSDVFLTKYTRDIPFILSQPSSQTVMQGEAVVMSVTAAGTGPFFSYQWLFNGSNIPNATNASLLLPSAQTNQAGEYRVLVGNYEGAVGSSPATLTVLTLGEALDSPGLRWESGGNAAWINQNATAHDGVSSAKSGMITNGQQSWLQGTIGGPARISFWWKVSSENSYDILSFQIGGVEQTNISGKIDWKYLSFLVPSGTQTVRWAYTKDESESVGQDSGWVDEISVVYAPAITAQPTSQTLVVGSPLALMVGVTGTAPFSYQWQRDGQDIPSGTNQNLMISNILSAEAGAYTLRVSNSAALVTSSVANVTVLIPPKIVQEPASHIVSPGQSVELAVNAMGQEPLTYQWRLNGVDIPGATSSSLLVTNLDGGKAGAYSVIVTSPTGTSQSAMANVTLSSLIMLPTVVLEGTVGGQYRIDYKDSVNATNWTVLTNISLLASPFIHVDHTAQGQPNRFYRVVGF